MNVFQQAINDVFNVPQFREYFYHNGVKIPCVIYETDYNSAYTQFGMDQNCNFAITVKKQLFTPKKGDKIIFKNQQYKIDTFTLDSYQLTYKFTVRK